MYCILSSFIVQHLSALSTIHVFNIATANSAVLHTLFEQYNSKTNVEQHVSSTDSYSPKAKSIASYEVSTATKGLLEQDQITKPTSK